MKYRVYVTGMAESTFDYIIDADSAEEAGNIALKWAEEERLEDAEVSRVVAKPTKEGAK